MNPNKYFRYVILSLITTRLSTPPLQTAESHSRVIIKYFQSPPVSLKIPNYIIAFLLFWATLMSLVQRVVIEISKHN